MAAQPSFPAAPPTLRLLEPPPASGEPEWVSRTWSATTREVRRFLKTAWAFGRAPRETARLWAEGRFDAMNPLAYLLNTLAIVGPWRALWQRLLGLPDLPLYQDVLQVLSPFLGVVVSGSLVHFFFVQFARSRRKLASTWAISIYATAGLPTVLHLVSTPFALLAANATTPAAMKAHWLAFVLSQVTIYPVFVWYVFGLAGLHGTSRRRATVLQIAAAVSGALLAIGVAFEVMLAAKLLHHLRH